MGSKKIRPVTPGMRGQVSTDFKDITKKKPEKSLLQSKKSSGGRNNKGRITSRHRGGGHKQKYRVIDFKRVKDGIQARVAGIEYDPNRNARIALLHYVDGEKAYIIAPDGIEVDSIVESGSKADIKDGNCLPLRKITSGTFADARIAASNVSQHATSFDDNKIVNDISTLAIRQASNENKGAYNTNSMYVDVFQDDTGIGTETNTDRNASEYVDTAVQSTGTGSWTTDSNTSVSYTHLTLPTKA